jgi:hypothetical protein
MPLIKMFVMVGGWNSLTKISQNLLVIHENIGKYKCMQTKKTVLQLGWSLPPN